jgi:hypothetical protein
MRHIKSGDRLAARRAKLGLSKDPLSHLNDDDEDAMDEDDDDDDDDMRRRRGP